MSGLEQSLGCLGPWHGWGCWELGIWGWIQGIAALQHSQFDHLRLLHGCCAVFRSRINSAQLWARSDLVAVACSWHATSCICRGQSWSSSQINSTRKNKNFLCVSKVNSLGGWMQGAAKRCWWEVWLKLECEHMGYGGEAAISVAAMAVPAPPATCYRGGGERGSPPALWVS